MKTQHTLLRKVPHAALAAILSLSLVLKPAYAVDALPGTLLNGTNTVSDAGGIINGNSSTGFFVQSGSLTITNATLQNFSTVGGSGSGGGGALGGALFINSGATVTLNNVSFLSNNATGGTGGAGQFGGVMNNMFTHQPDVVSTVIDPNTLVPTTISTPPVGYGSNGAGGANADGGAAYVNGGNGGNGYNGGIATNATSGFGGHGGTGGGGSDGSSVTADTVKTALDVTYDGLTSTSDTTAAAVYTGIAATMTAEAAAASAGANAGGPTTINLAPLFTTLATEFTTKATDSGTLDLTKDTAKAAFDAAYLTAITVTNLAVGVAGNGGAGGNGGSGGKGSDFYGGGYAGSGGGGGNAYAGSAAQGGPGGNGGYGGNGGFGAGGGQGGNGGSGGTSASGADGILGSAGTGGIAGFGGGSGASGNGFGALAVGGSGGNALGGGIFVRAGATLTIEGNALFDGNGTHGGSGQAADANTTQGASGIGVGTDLFMMTGSTVNLNPGAGNTITFNGNAYNTSIADDSAASMIAGGGASPIAPGAGADIHIQSGLVQFNGNNVYSGHTFIEGGTLQAQDGAGIYWDSNIDFKGTTTSDAVLMSSGSFTRYVGSQSNRVQWEGSGGFAAVNSDLTVSLSNSQTMAWNTNGFVPTGSDLVFGSLAATNNVHFQNGIDLTGGSRTILSTTSTAATGNNPDGTPTGSTVYMAGVILDSSAGATGALNINDATHTGTVVLSGASSYTGTTNINAGTVDLTGSLASNSVNVGSGSTLNSANAGLAATAAVTNAGTLNLGSTSNTITTLNNTGTLNGTATLSATTYNLNDGSVINAKLGTGTVNTTGAVTLNNTVGAAVINVANSSTLNLAAPDIISHTAAVAVNGTLNLTGGAETFQTLTGTGTVHTNGNMLNVANGSTFSGSLDAPGTNLVTGSSGSGGALDLNGGGTTTTQSTTIDNGLTVGAGTTLNSSTISIAPGQTLDLSAPGATINFTTLTSTVKGAPAFINIGSNDFVVPVGSTLAGNITFIGTGNVTILGTISPGFSPGVDNLTGFGLSPFLTGIYNAQLAGTGGVGGTDFDQVQIASGANLTIGGALNVAGYGGFTPKQGNTFQIISGPGGAVPINHLIGTFSTVTFDPTGTGAINLNSAGFVFDVNTGKLTTTGLNSATNTYADLGGNANQRAAAASIFNAAFVGKNQIDSSTTAGKLALQITDATGSSSGDLARYTPSYYGSLADYAFMGNQVLARSIQDRVSMMNYIPSQVGEDRRSQVPETMSVFMGYTYAYQNTADAARATRNDYYAGVNLLASEDYVVGIAGSASQGSINAALGSAKSDGWGSMAFARYTVAKSFTFFGSFGFNQQSMDLRRQTVNGTVTGSTDVTSYVGFLGVQYKGWRVGEVSIAPRVSFTYSNSRVAGFNESGAIDALTVSGYRNNRCLGEAGFSALWSTDLAGKAFNLEVAPSIQQSFLNSKSQMAVNIATVPAATYGINFASTGSTQAVIRVNVGYEVVKNVTTYVGYEGHFGNQTTQYAKAGIRFNF